MIEWRVSQSSQPGLSVTTSLAYILKANKTVVTAMHVPIPMYKSSARDGGLSRLDTTPGGGEAAGRFAYCE